MRLPRWLRRRCDDIPVITPGEQATGDDPVTCGLCGRETSVAMIATHLEDEHGIDPADIANATIVDRTEPGDAT